MTTAAGLALLIALALAPAPGRASADWKWTRGQGWSEGAGAARETAAEQFRYARTLEERGEYYDATRQYFLLVRTFPDSPEAAEALERVADCLFRMENYYQSFQAIEQVLTSYPRSGRLSDLLAVEYRIGLKLQAGARKSLLEEEGDTQEASLQAATEVFAAVLRHDPYGPYADDSLLALGETYLRLNDATKAREHFNRLMSDFPKSDLTDRVRVGLARCDVLEGKSKSSDVRQIIAEMRGRRRDGNGNAPARTGGGDALEKDMVALEELEAEKMWKSAQFYEERATHRSRKAALFTYNEIIRRFPRTSYARMAHEKIGKVEVPPEEGFTLPKINLNPFRDKKEPPPFVTPQKGPEAVQSEKVLPPIPGAPMPPKEEAVATVAPAAPAATASPATPTTGFERTPDTSPAASLPREPVRETRHRRPAPRPLAPPDPGEQSAMPRAAEEPVSPPSPAGTPSAPLRESPSPIATAEDLPVGTLPRRAESAAAAQPAAALGSGWRETAVEDRITPAPPPVVRKKGWEIALQETRPDPSVPAPPAIPARHSANSSRPVRDGDTEAVLRPEPAPATPPLPDSPSRAAPVAPAPPPPPPAHEEASAPAAPPKTAEKKNGGGWSFSEDFQ